MKRKPASSAWGQRAQAAGLPLVRLAELAGQRQDHISRSLAAGGQAAGHLIGLILAWEILDAGRRDAWRRSLVEPMPVGAQATLAALGPGFLLRHSHALLLALDRMTHAEREHWRAAVMSAITA